MTEAGWLNGTDLDAMLECPGGEASHRKLRLFACACCRRVWHLLNDERSRQAVEIAERHADGEASQDRLVAAYKANDTLRDELASIIPSSFYQHGMAKAAVAVARATSSEGASLGFDQGETPTYLARWEASGAADAAARALALAGRAGADLEAARPRHVSLLRDVVGNPFGPVAIVPAILTATAVSLAQAAYVERALPQGELEPARLNVLADALEDAGCTNAELLSHLRSSGPHVRGCWALDLILGKQ